MAITKYHKSDLMASDFDECLAFLNGFAKWDLFVSPVLYKEKEFMKTLQQPSNKVTGEAMIALQMEYSNIMKKIQKAL